MELTTISQVSKMFGVSTRTLRYYEAVGLLKSARVEDYSYRVYDEDAVLRLRQIIVLRKLRISLKEIGVIFQNPNAGTVLDIFMRSIGEIDDEVTALSTMRAILEHFVKEIKNRSDVSLKNILFDDERTLSAIKSLSLTKIPFKEERSMEDLNAASEGLSKLKNVRILHLPPCTVVSSHYIGECPEENAGKRLEEFLKAVRLYEIKPDSRVFGFNHPNPSPDRAEYGYEVWATIPDDMEVPAPLTKKRFPGGEYAAHTIVLGNFHEWEWLIKWVEESPKYAPNWDERGTEVMGGLLEEHLNWVYHSHLNWPETDEHQLDLLFPIKLK